MGQLQGKTILITEDHWIIAAALQTVLTEAGAHVVTAGDCASAFEILETRHIDAGLLDYKLGDGDSRELCETLRARNIPFVILSGYEDADGKVEGAGAHLSKPCPESLLVQTVVAVLQAQLPPRRQGDGAAQMQ